MGFTSSQEQQRTWVSCWLFVTTASRHLVWLLNNVQFVFVTLSEHFQCFFAASVAVNVQESSEFSSFKICKKSLILFACGVKKLLKLLHLILVNTCRSLVETYLKKKKKKLFSCLNSIRDESVLVWVSSVYLRTRVKPCDSLSASQSPADKTQRIHAGDEVVQVNKQTVVSEKDYNHTRDSRVYIQLKFMFKVWIPASAL